MTILKSCPTCGSVQLSSAARVVRHHKDAVNISCSIQCDECNLCLCQSDDTTDYELVRALCMLEDQVNKRWNTRIETTEYHKN